MEYLRQNDYQVLSLSEVVQHLLSCTPFPPKSLAITLDDGFRDNYDQAFSILEQNEFTATIFLVTSYIDTDRLPTLTRTDYVPTPLTWDQVKEMYEHGIEFGSHTLTHPMLSQVPLDQVRREVAESKRVIEDRLGTEVRFFCYPRGDFSAAVQQVVQEEGYQAACTIVPGVNDWKTDLFTLRRTYVSRHDTVSEFAKKIAGAYDFLQQGIYLWRQVSRRRVN
jgi:peptidoglycan/xylan/chitin deacetylase (PgdA/CDA1 family)